MKIPGRLGKRGHGGLPSVLQALLALFCWSALMVQFAVGLQCKVLRIFNPATADQLSIRYADSSKIIDTAHLATLKGMGDRELLGHVLLHDGELGHELTQAAMDYLFDFVYSELHPSDRLRGWCECTYNDKRGYGQDLLRALDGHGQGLLNTLIQHGSGILTEATRPALQEQLVDDRTVMVTMFDVYRTGRIVMTFFCRPVYHVQMPTQRSHSTPMSNHKRFGDYLGTLRGAAVLDFVHIALFHGDTSRQYSFQLSGTAFSNEVRQRISFDLPKLLEVKAWQYSTDGSLNLGRQYPWEGGPGILEPSVNGMPLTLPKNRLHLELYNLDNLARSPPFVAPSARPVSGNGALSQEGSEAVFFGHFHDGQLYKFLSDTSIENLSSFLAAQTMQNPRAKEVRSRSAKTSSHSASSNSDTGGSIINNKKKEQLGFGPHMAHKLFEVPEPHVELVSIGKKGEVRNSSIDKRMSPVRTGDEFQKFADENSGECTMVEIKDVYDNGEIIFTLTLFWKSLDVELGDNVNKVIDQVKQKIPDFVIFRKSSFLMEGGQKGGSEKVQFAEIINPHFCQKILKSYPLAKTLSGSTIPKQENMRGRMKASLRKKKKKKPVLKIPDLKIPEVQRVFQNGCKQFFFEINNVDNLTDDGRQSGTYKLRVKYRALICLPCKHYCLCAVSFLPWIHKIVSAAHGQNCCL